MKSHPLRRAGALLLALALSLSLLTAPAAAADDDTKIHITNITLSPDTLSLHTVSNKTGTVTATVAPSDTTDTYQWNTSNEKVATVDENGVVTAVGRGTCRITALSTDLTVPDLVESNPCVVTVDTPDATGVNLDKSSVTIQDGTTDLLTATVLPEGATQDVTWSVSPSTSSITVRYGVVSVPAGTPDGTEVTITAASAEDPTKTASCKVTVKGETPPAPQLTVTLDKQGASIPLGTSLTLKATVTAPEGTSTDLTWDSTNRAKFRVDWDRFRSDTATITLSSSAKAGDQATIFATSTVNKSAYAVCAVTVVGALPPEVTGVQITTPPTTEGKNYVDIGTGNEVTLSALVTPSNASDEAKRVTWTSSDTSIAIVDRNTGKITGIAPGEAVITATVGDKNDKREIEVSGLLLSYIKKSESGGKGETISLTENKVVDIYQYRDISVVATTFGNARNKTLNWESSNTSVAQVVAGRVTGNYPGDNVIITASAAGTNCKASFKVRVSEDVAQAITVNMGSEPSYSFSNLLSELNKRSQDKAKGPLDYVFSLKVSTKNGVLYYKYNTPENPGHGVGGTERYYYQANRQGQMALRDVTFVPLPGFDGTAVVDYNAVSTNGTTFTGTIRIEATATGDVSYITAEDQPAAFSAEHFSAVCKGRTGQAVRYITFGLPSASRGTLYYNYSPTGQYSPKVDGNTRYYVSSSPSIDNITFVPAKGFTGDVEIPYRCMDSSGNSYTGTVSIRVNSGSGAGSGSVEYSTGRNQRRSLNASDFNDACRRAADGTLDYIRFTSLPSSGAGTLYYNYSSSSSSKAVTGRNYYRSSSPRISDLTFVPATGYSGTVTIPFTGTSTSGVSFSGDLVIHVDDGTGTIHYSTARNQSVTFAAGDFNNASRDITGRTLDYVRFTSLPSSSTGVLYYNYSGSSSSRVSTGTDYRWSGSPSISNITFVPASGYNGTVSIPFTGYDASGSRFNGTVTIAVGSGGSQLISYSTVTNGAVRFSASDFNSACRSATGDTLNYVRFDLPSSTYGTLYHQYNTASRTGNSVGSGTNFYYSGSSSRLVGDVSFAAASTAGTASFGFTGYSTRGDSFTGTVEVRITGSAAASSAIRYSGSSAAPIPFRAVDFQNACQAALGTQLSYVQFTSLPYTGHLYRNYSSPARTGTGVTAATRYDVQAVGQISYLPKAEYQGTISIPFTAYDAQNASCSGTVELQLSNAYCSASFDDTASGWDWAKTSIEFLRRSGITNGYGNNTYRPGQSISRGEFTLMICRAFQFPTTGTSGFPDVPANSVYAGAVASARNLGIVQGNNGRFQPDQPITRQSAMTMICRAIEAAGQSLPAADTGLLASYTDGYQVSAYARSSVAALVQMQAVRGNTSMRLNPGAAISRAEMAVILHRVLTR